MGDGHSLHDDVLPFPEKRNERMLHRASVHRSSGEGGCVRLRCRDDRQGTVSGGNAIHGRQ